MTVRQYYERFHRFYTTLPDAISQEVERTSDVLLSLNEDQLLYGRDAKGNVLTPDYMDDPYFEGDLKAAARYKRKKEKYEDIHWGRIRFTEAKLFPDKNGSTPNLLINGNRFMNHLFINTNRESYGIASSGIVAGDIERKYAAYGHPVYGLAPVSAEYYYFGYLRPNAIVRHFNECMQ
jgi:hypothetical protein